MSSAVSDVRLVDEAIAEGGVRVAPVGTPDRAARELAPVTVSTLLIVGSEDPMLLEVKRAAAELMARSMP
jgi:hypothetical protein